MPKPSRASTDAPSSRTTSKAPPKTPASKALRGSPLILGLLARLGPLTAARIQAETGTPPHKTLYAMVRRGVVGVDRQQGHAVYFLPGPDAERAVQEARAQVTPKAHDWSGPKARAYLAANAKRRAAKDAQQAERFVRPCFAHELPQRFKMSRQGAYDLVRSLLEQGLVGEIVNLPVLMGERVRYTTLYYRAHNPDSQRLAQQWADAAEVAADQRRRGERVDAPCFSAHDIGAPDLASAP